MKWIPKIIKQIKCNHTYKFHRHIGGDELNQSLEYRSEWYCDKCDYIVRKKEIHENGDDSNEE